MKLRKAQCCIVYCTEPDSGFTGPSTTAISAAPHHPLTLMQSWGLLPNPHDYLHPLTLGGPIAPLVYAYFYHLKIFTLFYLLFYHLYFSCFDSFFFTFFHFFSHFFLETRGARVSRALQRPVPYYLV